MVKVNIVIGRVIFLCHLRNESIEPRVQVDCYNDLNEVTHIPSRRCRALQCPPCTYILWDTDLSLLTSCFPLRSFVLNDTINSETGTSSYRCFLDLCSPQDIVYCTKRSRFLQRIDDILCHFVPSYRISKEFCHDARTCIYDVIRLENVNTYVQFTNAWKRFSATPRRNL